MIKDKVYEINIDISINKIVDPYNSMLVFSYALIDSRFHKLALILKFWNKESIKDKNERLNSYSLVLLLIAYFQ